MDSRTRDVIEYNYMREIFSGQGARPRSEIYVIGRRHEVLPMDERSLQVALGDMAIRWNKLYGRDESTLTSQDLPGPAGQLTSSKELKPASETFSLFKSFIQGVDSPRGRKARKGWRQIDLEKLQQHPGYEVIEESIKDPNFFAHRELAHMVQHYVREGWQEYHDIRRKVGETDRPDSRRIQVAEMEYRRRRQLALPLLQTAVDVAAQKDDKQEIHEIFEGFEEMKDEEAIKDIMLGTFVSSGKVLPTVVACNIKGIKGYQWAIDTVGDAERATDSEDLRERYLDLYSRLQGKQVRKITLSVNELYGAIDFGRYELNTEELTKKEVGMIYNVADDNLERRGFDPQSESSRTKIAILDVAAGPGRHLVFVGTKYTYAIGVDSQPEYIDQIHTKGSSLLAKEGNWNDLDEDWGTETQNFIYIVGRSVSHAGSIQDMVELFKKVRKVLVVGGDLLFDQPDVTWGKYKDDIDIAQANAEELGIENFDRGVVFDGPDSQHNINRLLMGEEQVRAIALLTGFDVVTDVIGESRTEKLENGAFNRYYHLRKQEESKELSEEQVRNCLETLGVSRQGIVNKRKLDGLTSVGLDTVGDEAIRNILGVEKKPEVPAQELTIYSEGDPSMPN